MGFSAFMTSGRFRFIESTQRFLLGHDIFVSYARRDGALYAYRLVRRLEDAGFACSLDQRASLRGATLPWSLRRELARSSALVVVASAGAQESTNVSMELREFAITERAIHLITFPEHPVDASDSRRAHWGPLTVGLFPITEDRGAFARQEPSVSVIDRLQEASNYRKRAQRQRRAIWLTLAAFLIGTAVAATGWGVFSLKAAQAELRNKDLTKETQKLEASRREADAQANRSRASADAAARDAKDQRQKAEEAAVASQDAEAAKRRADAEALKAQGVAREADREAATARDERLAAETAADEGRSIMSAVAKANEAMRELSRDPKRALELALQGANERQTPETVAALRAARTAFVPNAELLKDGYPRSLTFSEDSRSLFVQTDRTGMTAYDATGARRAVAPNVTKITGALAGGALLVQARSAAGGGDSELFLWNPSEEVLRRVPGRVFGEPLSRNSRSRFILHSFDGEHGITGWTANGNSFGTWNLDDFPVAAEPYYQGDGLVALTKSSLYSFRSGKRVRRAVATPEVPDLALSPKGDVVVVGDGRKLQVWALPEVALKCEIEEGGPIRKFGISPDGGMLIMLTDGAALVRGQNFCAEGGPFSRDRWNGFMFSQSGRLLTWGYRMATVWDPDLAIGRGLNGHRDSIVDATIDNSGCRVATAAASELRVWNTCADEWPAPEWATMLNPEPRESWGDATWPRAAFGGPEASKLHLSGSYSLLVDVTPKHDMRRLWAGPADIPEGPSSLASFDSRGDLVAFLGLDRKAHVLSTRAAGGSHVPPAPWAPILGAEQLTLSGDGRWLAVTEGRARGKAIVMMDVATRQRSKAELVIHSPTLVAASGVLEPDFGVAAHPTESILAISNADGVAVWDWAGNRLVHVTDARARGVLKFNRSGTALAVSLEPGAVAIFKLSTGGDAEAASTILHVDRSEYLDFSPDGRLLVATSWEDVEVYEVESGRKVWHFHIPASAAAAFVSNTEIVTTTVGGTVRRLRCLPCYPAGDLQAEATLRLQASSVRSILAPLVVAARSH